MMILITMIRTFMVVGSILVLAGSQGSREGLGNLSEGERRVADDPFVTTVVPGWTLRVEIRATREGEKIDFTFFVTFDVFRGGVSGTVRRACAERGVKREECEEATNEVRLLRDWVTMRRSSTIALRRKWRRVVSVRSWNVPADRPAFHPDIPSFVMPPPVREVTADEVRTFDVSENVAIIVPYRDREAHLNVFLSHMANESSADERPAIFVIEQDDDRPFNRGWLMNVGAHVAMYNDRYGIIEDPSLFAATTLVLHDVDTLPDASLRPFYVRAPPEGSSFHLVNPMWDSGPELMYANFGGINVFRASDFVSIDGFPNNIHGWGLEDDCIRQRASLRSPPLNILRPLHGTLTFLPHESNRDETKLRSYANTLRDDRIRARGDDGLSTLRYRVNGVDRLGSSIYHVRVTAV